MSKRTSQRGFTLIEILVAIAIFSIALLIVIGAYSRFVRSQRSSIGSQELLEDVRLTLEVFNREARTAFGSTYRLLEDGNADGITFRNQNGVCVLYLLQDGVLVRNQATTAQQAADCSSLGLYNPADDAPVSDAGNEVVIEELHFQVTPAAVGGDTQLSSQGYVTVTMVIRPSTGTERDAISLQSTVTSRQVISYESLL